MCKLLWGVCCIYIYLYIKCTCVYIWHVIAYMMPFAFCSNIVRVIAEVVWLDSTTLSAKSYRTKHPNIRHCTGNDRSILINPTKTDAAALRFCLAHFAFTLHRIYRYIFTKHFDLSEHVVGVVFVQIIMLAGWGALHSITSAHGRSMRVLKWSEDEWAKWAGCYVQASNSRK